MAISRCLGHVPHGRTRNYTMHVRPVGYPNTALVCGSKECCEPGLIWLEDFEADAYRNGERIFMAFTTTMKMKAES